MKKGSDKLLDQHGHLLDIAQYTFEVTRSVSNDAAQVPPIEQ
jgi:hypothetical protein